MFEFLFKYPTAAFSRGSFVFLAPWPVWSLALLVLAIAVGMGPLLAVPCGAALIGAILAAVHHAEVVHLKGDSYRLKDRDLGRVPHDDAT